MRERPFSRLQVLFYSALTDRSNSSGMRVASGCICGCQGVESLDYFQASLSFLLGFGSPDPDNAATFGTRWVFIENNFHHLAAPEIKTPAHSEAFFRGIEDDAG